MATKKKAGGAAAAKLPGDLQAAFEARFGEGSLLTGKDRQDTNVGMPVVRTGIPTLDYALGVGGIPRSIMTEIFGTSGNGKTWLVGRLIAEAQKSGGNGAILDVEGTLNPGLMVNAGVDWDKMFAPPPETGPEAFAQAEVMLEHGLDVVCIDSVPALLVDDENEYNEDAGRATLARFMSANIPKLLRHVKRSNTAMILINQLREKPGVSFGSPEYQPGGRALPFYAGLRLSVRKSRQDSNYKDGDGRKIGHRLRVVVEKSKVAAPHAEAEFNVFFREGHAEGYGECTPGLDLADAYLTLLEDLGGVSVSSSWYTLAHPTTGEVLGKKAGRRKAAAFLMEGNVGPEILDPLVYKTGA